jgi:membrane associated rhomboid family serine protease
LDASGLVQLALFALIVVAAAGLYFMKPDERRTFLLTSRERARQGIRMLRAGPDGPDEFHQLLRTRTPWPIVAPILVAVSVWVWMGMAFGAGAMTDAERQIAWGANYAPRTTNGEWWRLVGYTFAHGSFLQLLAAIAVFLTAGIVLERLVGRIAVAAVYVSAALAGGAINLSSEPATTVTAGATGALIALYGLLAAMLLYAYLHEPRLPVSPLANRRLAAGFALFVLALLFTDGPGATPVIAGLVIGLAAGLVIAHGVDVEKPGPRRPAGILAAAVVIVAFIVLPYRGTIDARPEILRIADVETTTASAYAKAADSFTNGRTTSKALAQLIEKTIIPALEAERARIEALRGVPHEQAPLVADARRYFELRVAAWHQRASGLSGANMKVIKDANLLERSALDAYEQVQQGLGAPPS